MIKIARIHFWQYIVDDQGRPLQDVNVRMYLSDNPAQEADIFTHQSLGAPTTSSVAAMQTDGNGFFEFWIGDEFENIGGYVSTQKFKLTWSRAGIQVGSISNIDVFPPVFKVDEADNVSSTVTDKNKTISNELAYKWDTHVDSGIASTPHDFQAVDTTKDDATNNKLVSNYLMNYILSAIVSAGATGSLDISAAAIQKSFALTTGDWAVSGDGSFYYDLTHFLARQYPVVQVVERKGNPKLDNYRIAPKNVLSVDKNTVRLSMERALNVEVTIIG